MPTEFCEAVVSVCGVMWKLGQNATIAIYGLFFYRKSFIFFWLIMIHYGNSNDVATIRVLPI